MLIRDQFRCDNAASAVYREERIDMELSRPTEDAATGYLILDARITRTGVFKYLKADGTFRRELRLPEEVFSADSMASFGMRPVTNDHPPVMVRIDNDKQFRCGQSFPDIRRDGEWLKARLQVTDAALIAAMKQGKRQISNGYSCDLEDKPGVYNGEPYDCVQRNIKGNHIAVVDAARAGPGATVRMDSAAASVVVSDSANAPSLPQAAPGVIAMEKINIDGVTYEVSAQVAQAINRLSVKHDEATRVIVKQRDDAMAAVQTEKGRADQAASDLAALQTVHRDAIDPVKMRAGMLARLRLEQTAGAHLGDSVKLDALKDREIHIAVLGKLAPTFKADASHSDEYLRARFDMAAETAAANNPALRRVAELATGGGGGNGGGNRDGVTHKDEATAIQEHRDRQAKRGTEALTLGAGK